MEKGVRAGKGLLVDEATVAATLDERLLFAPIHTLSAQVRRLLVVLCTVLAVGWGALLHGSLSEAWDLPDYSFYRDIADGKMQSVPQPFSARPLAPLLAHGIAAMLHRPGTVGFAVLAYVSLAVSALIVFWLLAQSHAPRWMFLAVLAVPFWPQLLEDAGLPDPLYTAVLAGMLLLLARRRYLLAALMMFPLMLVRESTTLTLVCLLLVGWRQLRWRGCAAALLSTALGAALVRRLTAGGQQNPEHLPGGLYIVGKVVSNSLRSVGVVPWSNVYPHLCAAPAWKIGVHVGAIRSFGVCDVAVAAPRQVVWAVLTAFSLLSALVCAGWGHWRRVYAATGVEIRFSLLYGALCFLLAPTLGTWYLRLVGYAWPLTLVAVPRLVAANPAFQAGAESRATRAAAGLFLLTYLLLCAVAVKRGLPEVGVAMALSAVGVGLAVALARGGRRAEGRA